MKEYEHPDMYPFETNATNIPRKSFQSQMSSTSPELKHSEFDSPDEDINGYDSVFGPKKSSRACKGKRYMEFMNAQKLCVISKRTKPRTISTSSSLSMSPLQPNQGNIYPFRKSLSCSQAIQKLDYDTFDHLYANQNATIMPLNAAMQNKTDAIAKMVSNKDESAVSPDGNRKIDVNEFELEHKINALHAHNLDEYLVRKQDTKKKKKVNDKRSGGGYRKVHKIGKSKAKSKSTIHAVAVPKTFDEAKAIVGSQKRKARKESITRRDVQQVTAIVQSFLPTLEPHFMPMEIAPFSNNALPSNTNRCGNSGLLMLATMAEVAANYAA